MDDFRPHLLIPETEVDYIEPNVINLTSSQAS